MRSLQLMGMPKPPISIEIVQERFIVKIFSDGICQWARTTRHVEGHRKPRLRNFQRHKTLTIMDYETREKRPPTKKEREAKKDKARREAEKALAVRKKEDDAFRAKFERLRAERLARENKS
jgi:hypothetical protein